MSSNQSPYSWLEKSLLTIHNANWYRSVTAISGLDGTVVELSGLTAINFASNNYLGLAGDERLIQAAVAAIQEYGTGSTGSRLLSGHRQLHRELEQEIASLKQTEDSIVFSSGYLANLGTISAIVGQKDLILGDLYNHSSLKKGAKLSGATVIDYLHCDVNDLEQKLLQHRSQYRRCLITTDSVFSMDGDLCPLPDLIALASEMNCMLLLDEAHATGVMGTTGAGCVEHFNCTGAELIQIGTLSKALGSLGGYVAGNAHLIDFLRNRAATWIYTTGLSPADTAAALAAIEIIKSEPERKDKLWNNINYLKDKLPQDNLLPSESPIICLVLDAPETALTIADKLQQAGIFAPAIRPPTVPTSRLRFSVMATHQLEHLEKLVNSLSTIL
ncbi:putative 8-amino-7-oxononanoate synthase [Hyella patelloides LEGE 07179]|uniref:8-amino-7-ketopelargonate synthase n=1 Tax=Hyella patelloides LEGE 07179 TaxID=945734 RepID=A0A563VS09_9CYAN|nr:8-amino-7-oxononanoate synthase [Hyella patelloides]VEP14240.1 putative 8-amino-7-oxononanoate synthase [Hyella patelloides LEGE 07179]